MGLLSEEFEPVVYVPDVKITMLGGLVAHSRFGEILEHLLKNTRIYNYNMSTVLHACQCACYFIEHRGWFRLQNLNMDDPICEPHYDAPMSILFKSEPGFIKDISGINIHKKCPSCRIEYIRRGAGNVEDAVLSFNILPTPDIDSNFLNQPNKRIDYEPDGIIERGFY